jgi:heme oxygenase
MIPDRSTAVAHEQTPFPPIGAELRAATEAAHRQLEERMSLLDAGLTLARYRGYLERFHGLYRPLEARLDRLPFADAGLSLAPRRKVPMLEADLLRLGTDPGSLPVCTALPSVGTLAEGLGVLYVLEGATLGGQVIRRHLDSRLGVGPDNGGAFFVSYGARVGEMWSTFQLALGAFAATHPEARGALIGAARGTFEAALIWLPERGLRE